MSLRVSMLLWLALKLWCPAQAHAATPTPSSLTLSNGIRLVAVHFPGSTNVSHFTFLPLGLVDDGPKQAQWSHLVEHLVIRSTVPDDLPLANAETLPDHMRLDFYGNLTNWTTGLTHHRRWLEGVPFTQASLDREKPRVKSECDFTARNLATHKFALAAWAQGLRYGETNVALLGDVDRASLNQIQAYRDAHLPVLSNVLVCVVGGVDTSEALSLAAGQLGILRSEARPVAPGKLHPGNREMTWDLDARHLIISWPMSNPGTEDFAALLVASQWLNARFFSDPELQRLTGMVLAGADLATPEGNFFYLSASLRSGSSFREVRQKLQAAVQQLSSAQADLSPMLSQELAESLTTLPDLVALKAQLPPDTDQAMVQANLGLQWGMQEFRYGAGKPALAKRLLGLTNHAVQRAAENYLQPSKASVTAIHAASQPSGL